MSRSKSFARMLFNVVLLGAVLLAGVSAWAQSPPPQTPGSFSGRLTGAGMDSANVTLTNVATGASQTTMTDSNGAFSFSNLMPGSYRVVVQLKSGLRLGENAIEITPAG